MAVTGSLFDSLEKNDGTAFTSPSPGGFPAGAGWMLVILNGDGPVSDDAGNSYTQIAANGTLKVYVAEITNSITVSTTLSMTGYCSVWMSVTGMRPGDYLGGQDSHSGSESTAGVHIVPFGGNQARYASRSKLFCWADKGVAGGFTNSDTGTGAGTGVNDVDTIHVHRSGVQFNAEFVCGPLSYNGRVTVPVWLGIGPLPSVTYDWLIVELVHSETPAGEDHECAGWHEDDEDDDGDVGNGADIAVNSLGWVYVSYRVGTSIKLRRTREAFRTSDLITVASDLSPSMVPTLCIDHHDNVFIWAHDADGQAVCYLSEDMGSTFSLWTALAGASKWPQGVIDAASGRSYLCFYDRDSSDLRLFYSDNHWLALVEIFDILPFSADARPAWLRLDRNGFLHLYFNQGVGVGSSPLHRVYDPELGVFSATIEDMTDPETVLSYWTVGLGMERGFGIGIDAFDPFAVRRFLTLETYGGKLADTSTWTPPGGFSIDRGSVIGVTWDQRERIWLAAKAEGDGELGVFQSADNGTTIARVTI